MSFSHDRSQSFGIPGNHGFACFLNPMVFAHYMAAPPKAFRRHVSFATCELLDRYIAQIAQILPSPQQNILSSL
jgi:hypothetical protein